MAAKPDRKTALRVLGTLEETYPDAHCALNYSNPLELLVATILSAQCTDVRVNQVTEGLFRRYPDAAAYAGADLSALEEEIRSTGFFRNKARNLVACGAALLERHGGEIPRTLEALTALPGVGRKTANVVLGNAFGLAEGLVVDTHVKRIAGRLGWTRHSDPERIERDLCALFPREKWTQASHVLIFHGRQICKAPTPLCTLCPVLSDCPRIGVTRSR
ncbi:endonuclease III [Desulfuromonas versatilis]|uniref:Endonuclease III n=1 Tax=Desulfuromonas versatilis TaxID=2802975 RepID=A0ABM8HYI7_9BACT|nr:endonuclease III [Desulfuromonas versatilis]BCR07050.1 endonuclease III [Desulfuromonas versatilis]